MTIRMPMHTQDEGCCWRCRGTVEKALVTLGQEQRPSRMLPQGRSYGWRWTEATSAKCPTLIWVKSSIVLAWWYQAWRSVDTRTDTLRSRLQRSCHRTVSLVETVLGPMPCQGQPRGQRHSAHVHCLPRAPVWSVHAHQDQEELQQGRIRWQDYLQGRGMY